MMDSNNHFSSRKCSKCKINQCSCPVSRTNIGPIRAIEPSGPVIIEGVCGLCEYGYIYNLTPQTVAIEADVLFDSNGVMTPGIVHILGTSQIIVNVSGDYEVTFSVSGTEPNQFALFLNGTQVPGTVYGSGAGTQQNNGQAIFSIPAGGILTLRNHSSAAAVTLASVVGGTQANVSASIVIKMLNLNG